MEGAVATDDLLPAACAFAVSVLAEFEQDPDGVSEVEEKGNIKKEDS